MAKKSVGNERRLKNIAIVFGTRPEAIKLAPIIQEIERQEGLHPVVIVSGQHREMLDQVLEIFSIVPQVDLNIMQPKQRLGKSTAKIVDGLDEALARVKPDLVLVQGDTTTTFCGALTAFYQRIPVGHVEAGLRTGDLQAPWPEEANRCLTTRLAQIHFAPTETNRTNLLNEGVSDDHIHVTGNPAIDALLAVSNQLDIKGLPGINGFDWGLVKQNRFVLITGHRREVWGSVFESICYAIRELAEKFGDVLFVYPVHLNPHIQDPVHRILGSGPGNIVLLKPQPYLEFVALMRGAHLIITDSGGIQEEAPSLGKPVLVTRDVTERPEGVAAGTNLLLGTNQRRIVEEVSRLLREPETVQLIAERQNPYGDGRAAQRIVAACRGFLNDR